MNKLRHLVVSSGLKGCR